MKVRKTKYILFAILLWFIQPYSCLAQSPILENFSVFESSGNVYLNWTVGEGYTCSGIQIYHSLDSFNWKRIGEIGGICGSSSEAVSYSFVHEMPAFNTINKYRLQLGLLGFSNTLSITLIDIKKDGYRIYPNPVTNNSVIYFNNIRKQLCNLLVYNVSGSPVAQVNSNSDEFDISQIRLIAGLYFFTIRNEGGINLNGKFLVL